MGFVLGILIGLLGTIGLFGFLVYRLCTRCNSIDPAKLVNGIVQAVVQQPQSRKPSARWDNADPWRDDDEQSKT